MKPMKHVPGVVFAAGVAVVSSACLFPSSSDDDTGCRADSECAQPSEPCRENRCVSGACIEGNILEGLSSRKTQTDLVCRRIVCDGQGAERSLIDTTATPPDPTNDCKSTACDAQGNPTTNPNVSDIPTDKVGDCQKPACSAGGNAITTADDNDPPSATCMSYTCSDGKPKGTPANQGKVCSPDGFACGATGECNTCPAPDAACTDPGPGKNSRTPNAAYAFGNIGRCDNGGRSFCGMLAAGQSAYFSLRYDGTGLLCELDPHVQVTPTSDVTVCVGTQCKDVTAAAGGMSFTMTHGQTIVISVKAKSVCTGYHLYFHL